MKHNIYYGTLEVYGENAPFTLKPPYQVTVLLKIFINYIEAELYTLNILPVHIVRYGIYFNLVIQHNPMYIICTYYDLEVK